MSQVWKPDPARIVTAEQTAAAAQAAALAAYKAAFDGRLDAVAQSRGYDNRMTIVGYQGSTNSQWAAEANAFAAWRDQALGYMFQRLEAVQSGSQPAPTVETFVADMPSIVWPTDAGS